VNLNDLYHLLYGFDQFFASRPQSIHPHDSPIFKVHVIPFDLGTDIRNSDPDEAFFHVEFYPPDRAELWNSKAWNESLTKRLRLAGQVTTYYCTPDEQLRADVECNLIKHFKSVSLPFRHARRWDNLFGAGLGCPNRWGKWGCVVERLLVAEDAGAQFIDHPVVG